MYYIVTRFKHHLRNKPLSDLTLMNTMFSDLILREEDYVGAYCSANCGQELLFLATWPDCRGHQGTPWRRDTKRERSHLPIISHDINTHNRKTRLWNIIQAFLNSQDCPVKTYKSTNLTFSVIVTTASDRFQLMKNANKRPKVSLRAERYLCMVWVGQFPVADVEQ